MLINELFMRFILLFLIVYLNKQDGTHLNLLFENMYPFFEIIQIHLHPSLIITGISIYVHNY